MNFSKRNTLAGWVVFAIALLVYTLTLEPTLSLWDCGEFLVSAYKLEINHSPGSPFFMLLGRLFSLFSFGHPEKAAFAINMVSAVSSAATVMFLFWTISWLILKIPGRKYPDGLVLAASGIGALAYAFTDSFWFSAVEAEVYALSSLFSAAILWAATKWEREADKPYSNRWIVLVFFLIGLSTGVHLLNLLVIPTAALIWYFRKYNYSAKGLFVTIIASGAGILFLMKIFIPGILDLSKGLELLCVNNLHLPVNTGLMIYLGLIVALLAGGMVFSIKKNYQTLNLVLLCTFFLLIGYSSYVTTMIRSAANPPVDQGNPETTFNLLNYLNREQYGSRPVLYGPTFGSVVNGVKSRYTYKYVDGKYIRSEMIPKVYYDDHTTGIFPRLYSNEKEHQKAYRQWVDIRGRRVTAKDFNGEQTQTLIPTFEENLMFFLSYQLGYMYFRYFMWNFAGRQNDIQGLGEMTTGNWQSGIPFIDAWRLGPQDGLPDEMKNNKARNSYYFLPLLLGLIGLVFHYKTDMQQFFGMLLLFLLMSVGLVIYLNEVPITPRERDYVYVGSFYVFCIWIGMGVPALFSRLRKYTGKKTALIVSAVAGLLAGPFILISQNYDDHDRSGRYTARDLARNYLESCKPNAILFTHADNDTYPLWYCQEVEGIRKDVRVVVMPYLNAGWYIEQLQRKIYDNKGLQFSIPLKKYQSGEVDYLYVIPKIKTEQRLEDVLDFIASDSAKTKLESRDSEMVDYIPVDKVSVQTSDGRTIPVNFNKKALTKGDIALWDIIANNRGRRPVYFSSWADPEQYGLGNYIRCDGLVFNLNPEYYESGGIMDMGRIAPEEAYQNLMKKCNWANLQDKSVYFDWHHRRMLASMQVRNAFSRLAKKLVEQGQVKKAFEVLEESRKSISLDHWMIDLPAVQMTGIYFEAGKNEPGMEYTQSVLNNLKQWLDYYISMDAYYFNRVFTDFRYKLYLYQELINSIDGHAPEEWIKEIKSDFLEYAEILKG